MRINIYNTEIIHSRWTTQVLSIISVLKWTFMFKFILIFKNTLAVTSGQDCHFRYTNVPLKDQ